MLSSENASEITRILQDWNNGEDNAKERLMPYVYDELKRQARLLMTNERSDHTLQPTALVHEAFIKISGDANIDWKNRSHFFGIASHLMRQILVQHARKHAAAKRGNNSIHFSIDDLQISLGERAGAILELDEVLQRLAQTNEEHAKIVEMKFFGGLSIKDIAEVLDLSERTIVRKWRAARLWLFREMSRS